jgi:hypothetical protein
MVNRSFLSAVILGVLYNEVCALTAWMRQVKWVLWFLRQFMLSCLFWFYPCLVQHFPSAWYELCSSWGTQDQHFTSRQVWGLVSEAPFVWSNSFLEFAIFDVRCWQAWLRWPLQNSHFPWLASSADCKAFQCIKHQVVRWEHVNVPARIGTLTSFLKIVRNSDGYKVDNLLFFIVFGW